LNFVNKSSLSKVTPNDRGLAMWRNLKNVSWLPKPNKDIKAEDLILSQIYNVLLEPQLGDK
jgi:hypothetical protein